MKCVYIYNPYSGKGKSSEIKTLVVEKLQTKFDTVDVWPTKKRGDATEFASAACGNYDVLVCSGGDGTINEIINGLANKENRPKIGYIPTGTVNDLAHSLKIPKNIHKALNIILDGKTTTHDIFKLNDKYGIYVSGFGMFTSTSYTASQKNKKRLGKLAYYFNGIKDFTREKKFHIKVTLENEIIEDNIILGLIVNSKYVSGYKINKMATCNDGNVNLILFKEKRKKGISIKMLFNVLKLFLFGLTTLKNSKNCIIRKINKGSIELEDNKIINIDGEKGLDGSFDLEVLKEHIEIFID